ncbi:MAG TPA: hypothetical protein ENI42_07065 [Thermoplasmatales archaeon]|nr:hypothetical protein [Thermoplasmatales archaeon]
MEIFACPKCGSRNIHIGTIRDGVLDGYTSRYVCRDCGYQGMPILFDSEKEYKKFIQGFKKNEKKLKTERLKLTEEERKVIKLLKEDMETEKERKQPKRDGRPIGVTLLAAVMVLEGILGLYTLYILNVYNTNMLVCIYYATIFILSAVVLPYGFLKGKSWAWTFGGVLYVLSLPIGLVFLYYITRPHLKAYFGK